MATFGFLAATATTSLTTVSGSTVPSLKVRRYDVRAANIGAADANIDLYVTNSTVSGYRAKNYPVPYNQAGSAPDLENGLVVPAGYFLQIKASAGSAIDCTFPYVEDDA